VDKNFDGAFGLDCYSPAEIADKVEKLDVKKARLPLLASFVLAIGQARAKAEKTLDSKFNIRAFHDAVLQLGSVPLPVLKQHIDRLIADEGKEPYPELERVIERRAQKCVRFCAKTPRQSKN
jgi:hypothetical protein